MRIRKTDKVGRLLRDYPDLVEVMDWYDLRPVNGEAKLSLRRLCELRGLDLDDVITDIRACLPDDDDDIDDQDWDDDDDDDEDDVVVDDWDDGSDGDGADGDDNDWDGDSDDPRAWDDGAEDNDGGDASWHHETEDGGVDVA